LEGRGIIAAAGGRGIDQRAAWAAEWMRKLGDRLRPVNVCCGDWSRVCSSESVLNCLGLTGVFLDPPYPTRTADGRKSREPNLYANDPAAGSQRLRDDVLRWCREWGRHPQIRVAVCGYEGDGYECLTAEGWSMVAWEAGGGYGNGTRGKSKNAGRERIWFSPACLS